MGAPCHKEMVGRLSAILECASEENWEAGTYWYAEAHDVAADIATEYNVSVGTAAGVIAALSPRCPWERNVKYAWQLFETGDAPVMFTSKRKALRIKNGEAALDVLAGNKVVAFYHNIMNPSSGRDVCVDSHACDTAVGRKLTDPERKQVMERKGGYSAVAEAYRTVADEFGLIPAQAQAIIWLAWRESHRWERVA